MLRLVWATGPSLTYHVIQYWVIGIEVKVKVKDGHPHSQQLILVLSFWFLFVGSGKHESQEGVEEIKWSQEGPTSIFLRL